MLVVAILCAPLVSENIQASYPSMDNVGNVQMIGIVLFTKYLVPFELAAIMLLVAMIAGIVLASKKMDEYLAIEDDEVEEAKEVK
jgi:NADH-quinone oxidoreductase subunit J